MKILFKNDPLFKSMNGSDDDDQICGLWIRDGKCWWIDNEDAEPEAGWPLVPHIHRTLYKYIEEHYPEALL